jgi:hypothetical protein
VEESKATAAAAPQLVTLTAEAAHNAVTTLVAMYAGMLADKMRELALVRHQMALLNQELETTRAKLTQAGMQVIQQQKDLVAVKARQGPLIND